MPRKGHQTEQKEATAELALAIFYEHELIKLGVQPDKRKVAMQNIPRPCDQQEVLSLLGMATYLAKFYHHFSECTAPITQLPKAENTFCLQDHGVALQKLKHIFMEAPVLTVFDANKPIVVQCDAS